MKKSKFLTLALVVCLIALGVIAFFQFGGSVSGFSYANADKYTAGDTLITAPVSALDVDWTAGRVKVEYHAGSGITVTETANKALSDDEKLHWWLDGTTLRIRYAKSGIRMAFSFTGPDKQLTVSLPEGTVLKTAGVGATSADLEISGLTADEITLGTTSGNIVASTDTRKLTVTSTSGDITLRQDSDLDDVSLGSTSGSIGCTLASVKKLAAGSTSGGLAVILSGTADKAALGSTSGSLSLDAPSVGKAALSSTSGSITVRAGAFDDLEIGSTSGNVRVQLPAKPGFTCTVGTVSGSFSSDLAMAKSGNTYTAGDGSAKCSIGTTSGSIAIGEYK